MSRTGEPLGPWWLERQLDPESPDFQDDDQRDNVTHRDWVQLGTVSTVPRAAVDPRGLVSGADGRWSIDWWVGADDRWYVPAREPGVRQRRLDGAPVIETVVRVPGGDALHRAYAVQGPRGPMAVVEVENRTAVPFALAFAVVPYGPAADGAIRSIELDGDVVRVDGSRAVLLPKSPPRVVGGVGGHTYATLVAGGAVSPEPVVTVRDGEARAELALVYPVPHGSGLRVLLPLHDVPTRSEIGAPRVPSADDVANGWTAQVSRGAHVNLPDDRYRIAFDAARRDLLLFHAGDDVLAWPQAAVPWTTVAEVVGAFNLLGFHAEAEQVLRAVPDEQRLDGGIVSLDEGPAANGAVLRAIGRHWQLTHDDELVGDLIGPIAKAAHWIDKRRRARRRPMLATATYADALWCAGGLRSTVPALVAIGQPEVAEDVERFARLLLDDVDDALAPDQRRREPANLVAAYLDVVAPDAEALVALVAFLRERATISGDGEAGLVVADRGAGFDPHRTLQLALAELRTGDPVAVARVSAVLDRSTPVHTWPEIIHPRSGGGARGHGQDPATTALFCTVVRAMLVQEHGADRLALCGVVPPAWLGQSWEVRRLPTSAGTLGYAVRWHGDRPALLWELEPWSADSTVTLTVPGLDPGWSSTALAGEALLAPVAPPARSVAPDRPDAGGTEASSSFA